MKKRFYPLIFILLIISPILKAQVYTENNGEIIFAFSDVEKLMQPVDTKMRFTLFLHLGQNIHYDFSQNFGLFSGYGLRNIGFITEEENAKIKRRSYSLGIPLAVKFGDFNKHTYVYGGGEYELFFHYKQKQFIEDDKTKQSEWFSKRTNRFVPSLFAGIQLPGGINLKFKYYLENFLNTGFKGYDFGQAVDYSGYNKTRLFYFSLSFNFKNEDVKKLYNPPGKITKQVML